jgi:hypothetical protein
MSRTFCLLVAVLVSLTGCTDANDHREERQSASPPEKTVSPEDVLVCDVSADRLSIIHKADRGVHHRDLDDIDKLSPRCAIEWHELQKLTDKDPKELAQRVEVCDMRQAKIVVVRELDAVTHPLRYQKNLKACPAPKHS